MIPTEGTILNMTPAAGIVRFIVEGDTWESPLIGWGVVVTHIAGAGASAECETRVEPVVLSGGCWPIPLVQYLEAGAPAGTAAEVIPR